MNFLILQGIATALSLFNLIEGSIIYSILRTSISISIAYSLIFYHKPTTTQPSHQFVRETIMTRSTIIMPAIISYSYMSSSRMVQTIYIVSLAIALYQQSHIHHRHKTSYLFPRIYHIGGHSCIVLIASAGYQTTSLLLLLTVSILTLLQRRL